MATEQIVTQNSSERTIEAMPPECYGVGKVKIPIRYYAEAFNWATVSPATCFSCAHERRCLAQQRRMRRR